MILRPFLLLHVFVQSSMALNILVFLLGTTQTERANMEFLAQQLALRHHTVVTVKPILIPEEPRLVKPKLHLVREKTLKNLLPRKLFRPLELAYNEGPWKAKYDYDGHLEPYYAAHNASCGRIINSDLIDGLQKDSIDVAIVYAGNPCQLAVCHVLGVPFIYYDNEGLTDETLVSAAVPVDLDFPLSNCRSARSSSQIFSRLSSAFCLLNEMISQSGIASFASLVSKRYRLMDGPITRMFAEDYSLKKRFPSFPDVNTLKKDASLYFINSDPLLEFERSLPSNVVPIGGMHMEHAKPLFAPWNETIAKSKEGTIVVSFGTLVNSSAMSESQASAIYGALSQLTEYRIIWNVGPSLSPPGIDVHNTLPHINITSFLPQNDILADKRTRLLITNGGMNSLMEAIVHGVPVMGIPLYGVNQNNLDKVAHKGLGIVLSKDKLTQTNVLKTIRTLLDSAKYKTVAKDMAKEFKSRHGRGSVFDKAVHYIEHVGKHRGAAFFRTPTNPWRQVKQLPLEMVLILLLTLATPLYISWLFVSKIAVLLLNIRPITHVNEPKNESKEVIKTAKNVKSKQ